MLVPLPGRLAIRRAESARCVEKRAHPEKVRSAGGIADFGTECGSAGLARASSRGNESGDPQPRDNRKSLRPLVWSASDAERSQRVLSDAFLLWALDDARQQHACLRTSHRHNMFHSIGNDLPIEFISDVVDVEAGSIATSLGAASGYIDREAANPVGSGGQRRDGLIPDPRAHAATVHQNQVADHIPVSPPDLRRAIKRPAQPPPWSKR